MEISTCIYNQYAMHITQVLIDDTRECNSINIQLFFPAKCIFFACSITIKSGNVFILKEFADI